MYWEREQGEIRYIFLISHQLPFGSVKIHEASNCRERQIEVLAVINTSHGNPRNAKRRCWQRKYMREMKLIYI